MRLDVRGRLLGARKGSMHGVTGRPRVDPRHVFAGRADMFVRLHATPQGLLAIGPVVKVRLLIARLSGFPALRPPARRLLESPDADSSLSDSPRVNATPKDRGIWDRPARSPGAE